MQGHMTKWYLFGLLALPESRRSTICDTKGKYHDGIVQSIQRQSGDGRSFNVTLSDGGKDCTVFVQTID